MIGSGCKGQIHDVRASDEYDWPVLGVADDG